MTTKRLKIKSSTGASHTVSVFYIFYYSYYTNYMRRYSVFFSRRLSSKSYTTQQVLNDFTYKNMPLKNFIINLHCLVQ
jgi:hypothetical protein